MKEHIVLVGGGYVSVWTYRQLVKKCRQKIIKGEIVVTVICPEKYHVFHGWTGEAITRAIRFHSRLSPLEKLMPLANHITGYATAVDIENNRLSVTPASGDEKVIAYTHLILGMGSNDSTNLSGSANFSLRVKALPDLVDSLYRIDRLAQIPDGGEAGRPHKLVVVGAGFTGVELATNLADYLQRQCRKNGIPAEKVPPITLINNQADILPQINTRYKKMMAYTHKIIRRYGIKLVNNTSVSGFDEKGIYLDDGRYLPADCCISTVGQSQIHLPGMEKLQRDLRSRLVTDCHLNIKGHYNIWGGGDACSVPHFGSGQSCPANALWAIKHGEHIGRNLSRILNGRKPRAFRYRGLGQAASLGLGKGITELYGFQFTGLLAWIMRWFFFMYFMPLHSTRINAWQDWLHVWGLGRKGEKNAEDRPAARASGKMGLAISGS